MVEFNPTYPEIAKEFEERERIRKIIQAHCEHEWGRVIWNDSCWGYRTCIKCGKVEDYYERD